MLRPVLIGLSALSVAACVPAPVPERPVDAAARAVKAEATAQAELDADAAAMEAARVADEARVASDPVYALVSRAESCLHWAGEEGYDDERRAEIENALTTDHCDTVVADGDALKAAHPADAAAIDEALQDLRP